MHHKNDSFCVLLSTPLILTITFLRIIILPLTPDSDPKLIQLINPKDSVSNPPNSLTVVVVCETFF